MPRRHGQRRDGRLLSRVYRRSRLDGLRRGGQDGPRRCRAPLGKVPRDNGSGQLRLDRHPRGVHVRSRRARSFRGSMLRLHGSQHRLNVWCDRTERHRSPFCAPALSSRESSRRRALLVVSPALLLRFPVRWRRLPRPRLKPWGYPRMCLKARYGLRDAVLSCPFRADPLKEESWSRSCSESSPSSSPSPPPRPPRLRPSTSSAVAPSARPPRRVWGAGTVVVLGGSRPAGATTPGTARDS